MPAAVPAPSVLLRFLALALAWGSSFLFIAVGLQGLSPPQVVLARLVLGALALAAIMTVTRRRWPRDPLLWAHVSVVALLLCVAPFTLFAWAQQFISSGLASIYNATTPLLTTLVAVVALAEERLTVPRVAGLALGFAGVVVVLGPWSGLHVGGGLLPQAACLAATACYGIAFVWLRRFVVGRGVDAVTVAACQVGVAALVALALAPLTATGPVRLTVPIALAVLVLGGVGTGMAYVWNAAVVAGWGAANASTVTYLTPLVGVTLGVIVLGEVVTWNQPAGAVLVVAGIALAQGRWTLGRWSPPRHTGTRASGPAGAPAGRNGDTRTP